MTLDQDTSTSQRSVAVQAKVHETTVQLEQQEREDEEGVSERLLSNSNAESLKQEPGSILGSVALLAGTTVGAGILALPAVTSPVGFIPSTAVILGCWLYSVVTGLLFAETNVRLMRELGRGGVSVLSMAKDTYGKYGSALAGFTYVFLHYCLLVAYVARGGELLTEFIETSPTMASVAFCLLLGTTIYVSESKVLDSINTSLVFGIICTFVGILGMALGNFDPALLSVGDTSKAVLCVPVVALAFVYHNVIPVVASNLEGDRKKITTAILAGSAIPLVMFLLWNAAILGYKVKVGGAGARAGARADGEVVEMVDPLKLLQADPTVGAYISVFSLLAIATSFIGFVLGLVDFIGDALKLPTTNSRSLLPFSLTLLPPTAFALVKPDIFMEALGYAGTYGVLLLFWILPSGMAWQTRKRQDLKRPLVPDMVPGGVPVLLLIAGSGFAIMLQQTLINVGAISK